jgi:hypothetical protein
MGFNRVGHARPENLNHEAKYTNIHVVGGLRETRPSRAALTSNNPFVFLGIFSWLAEFCCAGKK